MRPICWGLSGSSSPGRPLTFVHPLVRDGIYSELSSSQRAQGHRRAAELLAEQPGADARVAEHLLVSEPAGDRWVVDRLIAAARAARKQGAPESEAVFLRRALAEPPPPGDRSALLLGLGMAEASAGLRGLARAFAAGRGCYAERRGGRRGSDGAGARAQPRPALHGGGRSSRSRSIGARFRSRRARAPARGCGRPTRAERPRDRTLSGFPPREVSRACRERCRGATRGPGLSRVRLHPYERARRDRRRPRDPSAFGPRQCSDPSRTAGHGSRSQRGFRMPRSRFFWPNGMRSCGRCSMPRSRRRG